MYVSYDFNGISVVLRLCLMLWCCIAVDCATTKNISVKRRIQMFDTIAAEKVSKVMKEYRFIM